jgi:hypothetical protein
MLKWRLVLSFMTTARGASHISSSPHEGTHKSGHRIHTCGLKSDLDLEPGWGVVSKLDPREEM